MGTRRKFTRACKVEAVKLVRNRGVTMAQAARDLDVNVLRGWVRTFREDLTQASPGVGQQKPVDVEVTQLRREVARLKLERDILKKPSRIQLVVATPVVEGDLRNTSKASAGVRHPSAWRGRVLSVNATAFNSSAVSPLRSVPFGKYCRNRPFVFSFVARCHGLCGSQK